MKIKHNEIGIPIENPFANCKLKRERYARILTEIVGSYSDGFVLAIDNEWGTGKTTFVKMWRQLLINEEYQTIYFNAWENDFNNNPLVALMSELKPLTHGKVDGEKVFKSVVEKGAVLVKNVVPALAKSLIKRYVDIDVIEGAVENTTKAATEILEEEIEEYSDKKKTIAEFREELEKFIKKTDSKKPLVFIIDELDRCRPNYAVEVLEQMKHFFSVSGIVFVLSIDKNHLASSVKGFYGSEQINTDEYLRRFIDLEYSIPKPSNKEFCDYLFDYYSFKDFFLSTERKMINELQGETDALPNMAVILFNQTNATLRQQEKILGLTRLILNLFEYRQFTFSYLLFFLVYLKTMKTSIYKKIESNSLTLQELSDEFADLMPSEISKIHGLNLTYIQAMLLHFYNNNRDHEDRIPIFEKDNSGNLKQPLSTKLKVRNENYSLESSFEHINKQWNLVSINLNYLINKINLTEPFNLKQIE